MTDTRDTWGGGVDAFHFAGGIQHHQVHVLAGDCSFVIASRSKALSFDFMHGLQLKIECAVTMEALQRCCRVQLPSFAGHMIALTVLLKACGCCCPAYKLAVPLQHKSIWDCPPQSVPRLKDLSVCPLPSALVHLDFFAALPAGLRGVRREVRAEGNPGRGGRAVRTEGSKVATKRCDGGKLAAVAHVYC